jgi:hypothetical protein
VLLALLFEWGVALHGLYAVQDRETTDAGKSAHTRALIRKMARQAAKNYVLFPVLSRRRWWRTLGANVVANGLRNVWAWMVIVCGHFTDGAEKFTPSVLEGEETRMVPTTDAGYREFPDRHGAGVHQKLMLGVSHQLIGPRDHHADSPIDDARQSTAPVIAAVRSSNPPD